MQRFLPTRFPSCRAVASLWIPEISPGRLDRNKVEKVVASSTKLPQWSKQTRRRKCLQGQSIDSKGENREEKKETTTRSISQIVCWLPPNDSLAIPGAQSVTKTSPPSKTRRSQKRFTSGSGSSFTKKDMNHAHGNLRHIRRHDTSTFEYTNTNRACTWLYWYLQTCGSMLLSTFVHKNIHR